MSIDNKQRIIGFDIARVFSILIIVLYHSFGYGSSLYSIMSIRAVGCASLAVFTFQSGFLMAGRKDLQSCSFIDFIKKRLLRVWPLFFLSSMLLCLMGFNRWFTTAKAWLGLSSFWRPAPRTMWYVGLLIFLYVITLFWARGGSKKQVAKFLITMGIIAGIQVVFHSVDPRTFFYAPVYFLGIIVGQYYYRKLFSFATTPRNILLMLTVFVGMLIVQYVTGYNQMLYVNAFLGMVALMSLYLYLGEKWKDNKRLVAGVSWFSYATFCIYLFHREVFGTLLMIWTPTHQYQTIPYLGILGLAIVIPLAYYIQKGYDSIIKKLNL